MKFRVLAASAIAGCLVPTAFAQLSATHAAPQTKAQPHKIVADPGTGGSYIPLVGGSDSCTTPDVLSGPGPYAFNNSAATTGAEGQANAACNFFGTMGITNDVWFVYTAGSTGNATLALCGGTTMDSKVAVYAGNGCPGGAPLACNDDSCSVQSQLSWAASSGSQYTIQLGNYPSATGNSGTFTINVAGALTNDDCSTPVVLSGPGPYPFDNSAATTGSQGQANAACNFFGTMGINNDVWFTYNASATGNATFALCGGTGMDSKVAVYNGAGCPANPAIACNDDSCSLQSQVSWSATSGNAYTIQLGNYPSASGSSGTFTITVSQPLGPCSPLDDGSTENAVGLTAGGDQMWLQRFGAASQNTTVTAISSAWGSVINQPAQNPPNGSPVDILIYSDPNQDGNPTDGVVLQHVTGTLAGTGTDAFQSFNLSPPVTVNGIFWVGAAVQAAAGQFPAPLDQPVNPQAPPDPAWIVGNTSGPLNFTNLGANNVAPLSIASAGFPGQWLLRITCGSSTGTPFCVPHSAGMIPCPCTAGGTAGNGCNNSSNTGGAHLSVAGTSSLSNDSVVFTCSGEKPAALSVVLQGDVHSAAAVFGQGVICTGGNLLRLYTKNAVAGTVVAPSGGDPSVSARSAQLGDVLTVGATRYHQVYYRDPIVRAPCDPAAATFNISQGQSITWAQ